MENNNYTAVNIKYLRELNKMTQSDLAKKINKKTSIISAYEKGISKPPTDVLLTISSIFGVSFQWLVETDISLKMKKYGELVHQDVHLKPVKTELHFNRNLDTMNNVELYNISKKIKKLNLLYQRLIDVKLLNNKVFENKIEKDLSIFIEEFAKIKRSYDSDLFFTETGHIMYKEESKPFNINYLDNIEEYVKKLDTVIETFEDTLFNNFNTFYREYMKDWYGKWKNDPSIDEE